MNDDIIKIRYSILVSTIINMPEEADSCLAELEEYARADYLKAKELYDDYNNAKDLSRMIKKDNTKIKKHKETMNSIPMVCALILGIWGCVVENWVFGIIFAVIGLIAGFGLMLLADKITSKGHIKKLSNVDADINEYQKCFKNDYGEMKSFSSLEELKKCKKNLLDLDTKKISEDIIVELVNKNKLGNYDIMTCVSEIAYNIFLRENQEYLDNDLDIKDATISVTTSLSYEIDINGKYQLVIAYKSAIETYIKEYTSYDWGTVSNLVKKEKFELPISDINGNYCELVKKLTECYCYCQLM